MLGVNIIRFAKLFKFITVILIILTLVFIWSNSAENAEISSGRSFGISAFIKSILDPHDKIPLETFQKVIRKLAHFSEFALLGSESYFLSLLFTKGKITFKSVFITWFSCSTAAVIDEIIQIFSPGRACRVTDVLIDASGVLCGILFISLIFFAVQRNKRKAERDTRHGI